jgi:hypothetical protein
MAVDQVGMTQVPRMAQRLVPRTLMVQVRAGVH